jgi:hypothetical protein
VPEGAVTVTEAVFELLFSDAVTVAVWLDVTVPAVAVKLPVVDPAATVTEVGTVSAALLSETATEVLAVAAADNVTVHEDVPPDPIEAGEHWSPDTVGGAVVEIVPPLPDAVTDNPPGETAITLETVIETLEPAVEETPTLMVATTPLPMPAVFIPLAMHRSDPLPDTQVNVLPAAVRADPAVAARDVTSAEE